MKSLLAIATISTTLVATNAEAAMQKSVTFESQGETLVGTLFLPDNYQEGQKLPGVVVTGAWTTVKEQMSSTYATELADRGYAALVFDFRGWGASKVEDGTQYLESPQRKTEDINAATNYLVTRPEVDSARVAGLGICASAGYVSDAAAQNSNIQSFALVAPWLHDAEIVEATYGGAESVSDLIETSRQAASAAEPTILEAASTTNENAVMFQAPYYTESDRGLIPEYDNKFNAASWEGWLTYDAIQTARTLQKPALLVHSEAAAIPQGAKRYAEEGGENVELILFDGATQFDFYDSPEVVDASVDAVVKHFEETL